MSTNHDAVATSFDEVSPWALLLGQEPHVVVAGRNGRSVPGGLPFQSAGAVLVVLDEDAPRELAGLTSMLADCGRLLTPGGRIAVLARNPATWPLNAVRAFVGRVDEDPGTSNGLRAWRRRTLVRALEAAGYVEPRAFACAPATPDPRSVTIASQASALRTPAWLVMAALPGATGPLVIEEMLAKGAAEFASAGLKFESMTHSERGKSIAVARCGDVGVVLRIARCEAMRRDEERSFELLQRLDGNEKIRARVPRALSSRRVAGMDCFAQTMLRGTPLATALSPANRPWFVDEAERFLRQLNPQLQAQSPEPIDDTGGAFVGEPMVRFALRHISDVALRDRAASFVTRSLHGLECRRGTVHGDFGTGNILVHDGRITGVVDWEAAHVAGPPVLDAINYLDAVQRQCVAGTGIEYTLPAIALGDWPVAAELEFLRRMFEYCGADFGRLADFVLLYLLYHVGPQLRYVRRECKPVQRLERVLLRLMELGE